MKKIKFISLLIIALGMGFTSCEKDEPKEDPKEEPADFDIFEEISCDEMVFVKGGTFMMGATEEQGTEDPWDEEYPVHEVTVSDFYIGKYEVTQQLWEYVMGYNPSIYKGAKRPVVSISWVDCCDFIGNLNRLTGKNFDLPTEAEWEYAARGGAKSMGYKYAGGNNIDEVAWYAYNATGTFGTQEVGLKLPNELGLYDMSGNVCEWCSDWYDKNYYSSSPSENPTGPKMGEDIVYRGGSFPYMPSDCRVTIRGHAPIDKAYVNIGFRLVCRK